MAFHPFDSFRNALTDMRQHPFQTVGRIASRAGGPLVGAAVDQGFRYYNGHHELPTSGTALDMTRRSGDQAMQQGMDRPLNGPLGNTPTGQSDNTALAGALMGNQPHANNNAGGWNMAQNYGASHPSGGLGGLLSFLPPGQNNTPQGSFFTDPQYAPGQGGKLKERQNQGFAGSMLNGVSNFMVGGSPVINGVRPGMGNYNRFGGSSQAVVRGRTPGN